MRRFCYSIKSAVLKGNCMIFGTRRSNCQFLKYIPVICRICNNNNGRFCYKLFSVGRISCDTFSTKIFIGDIFTAAVTFIKSYHKSAKIKSFSFMIGSFNRCRFYCYGSHCYIARIFGNRCPFRKDNDIGIYCRIGGKSGSAAIFSSVPAFKGVTSPYRVSRPDITSKTCPFRH